MRKTKILIIALLGIALGVLIGGLLRSRPIKNEVTQVKERHYVLNAGLNAQPFWKDVISTQKQIVAATPGAQFDFGGPSDLDPGKQIEELDALLESKVDGIVVFPCDPKSLAPAIDKAVNKGIPVITIFADVADSKRLTFIGAPERESARLLAQQVIDDYPNFRTVRTKVLVSIPTPGMTSTDERFDGIKDVLAKYPTLELLPVVNDNSNDTKAAEVIGAALQRDPDIKLIFGTDARSAIGALSALKERGTPKGEVVITGWDSDEDVLRGIQEGWIHSTCILNSSLSVQMAFAILEAKTKGYLYPDSLRLRELNLPAVPDKLYIPEVLVNQKNVAGYFHKK